MKRASSGSTSHGLSLPYRVYPETLPLPSTHRDLQSSSRRSVLEPPCKKQHRDIAGNRLSWGLRPSSRHKQQESTRGRAVPRAHHVPPSGFLSLSTACSSRSPAALFHAAATCRVPPLQGFSLACSRSASSTLPCPHAVGRPTVRLSDLSERRSKGPFDFKALLHPRVRLPCSGITRCRGSIPSWVSFLFRVFLPPAVEPLSRLLRS
jgi:hypothetical protein